MAENHASQPSSRCRPDLHQCQPLEPADRSRFCPLKSYHQAIDVEPQNNPYNPPNSVLATRGLKPNWVRNLLLRFVFTLLWTFVFFFGSAILLGYASGIYFASISSTDSKPTDQTMQQIGFSLAIVPMVLGPIGFLLGILGLLPGTKWKVSS
jgi:hypothetical protein